MPQQFFIPSKAGFGFQVDTNLHALTCWRHQHFAGLKFHFAVLHSTKRYT